jgi:hypothetical protein
MLDIKGWVASNTTDRAVMIRAEIQSILCFQGTDGRVTRLPKLSAGGEGVETV